MFEKLEQIAIILASTAVTLLLLILVSAWIKKVSYEIWYQDMVAETIQELVKAECLKQEAQ